MASSEPQEHKGRPLVALATEQEWRSWLSANGSDSDAVWLTVWKKDAAEGGTGEGAVTLGYDCAVEEALCWGWIDSTSNSFDDRRYLLLMARRKPGSVWSGPNKERIERLVEAGRMQPAGLEAVRRAREDGSWSRLDPVEAGIVPEDLQAALDEADLNAAWAGETDGRRKQVLYQLAIAVRPETRQRRLEGFVEQLGSGGLRI